MNAELLERLASIDPNPIDADPPAGAWDTSAVLHEIERRMDMETQTQHQPHQTGPPRRRGSGPLVAAAVFAVIVVVAGILVLVAGGGNDTTEPAATVPPTTEAVPETTAPPRDTTIPQQSIVSDADLALAQAFVDGWNAGDLDAWIAPLTIPAGSLFTPDFLAELHQDGQAVGEEWEIERCTRISTGSGYRVGCNILHEDAFTRALGLAPWEDTVSFTPVDGKMQLWGFTTGGRPSPEDVAAGDLNENAAYLAALYDFQVWVDETHSEVGALTVSLDPDNEYGYQGLAIIRHLNGRILTTIDIETPENTATALELLPEYAATLESR